MKTADDVDLVNVSTVITTDLKRGVDYLERAISEWHLDQPTIGNGSQTTLSYGTVDKEGVCVITIAGTIDLNGAPELHELLIDCIARNQGIILCMADVLQIDTAGAATLIDAYVVARNNNVKFALAAASKNVKRALGIWWLNKILPMYEQFADAERFVRHKALRVAC